MPLILHVRDAAMDSLSILEESGINPYHLLHFHCWMEGDPQLVFSILQKYPNAFIGLTNAVGFHKNHELQQLVKLLPAERLVLETDAPFFRAGQSYSVPQNLTLVANTVAQLKNRSLSDICVTNLNNCKSLYPQFFLKS